MKEVKKFFLVKIWSTVQVTIFFTLSEEYRNSITGWSAESSFEYFDLSLFFKSPFNFQKENEVKPCLFTVNKRKQFKVCEMFLWGCDPNKPCLIALETLLITIL